MSTDPGDCADIIALFQIPTPVVDIRPLARGHINTTLIVSAGPEAQRRRFVVQRVNERVFSRPTLVMRNIANVLDYLRRTAPSGAADADPRQTLELIPARDAAAWVQAPDGGIWRCYRYVEDSRVIDVVTRPAEAAAAAGTFAAFLKRLAGYDGPPLAEVIPDFHNTPRRLEQLQAAADADVAGRRAGSADELNWLLENRPLASVITAAMAAGSVPLRIVHNDTKTNNILLDAAELRGLCVIDLDTLMPGSSLYDYGDLVRTAAAAAAEDDPDLSHVAVRRDFYEAIEQAWLDQLGDVLTPGERRLLPVASAVITYEQACRFLCDWLEGDRYYRIDRPTHNLDRARNQIALARRLLAIQ